MPGVGRTTFGFAKIAACSSCPSEMQESGTTLRTCKVVEPSSTKESGSRVDLFDPETRAGDHRLRILFGQPAVVEHEADVSPYRRHCGPAVHARVPKCVC